MAEENSIFVDGENLQTAIGRSIQEDKALLCFITDDGDESSRWEVALLDDAIQDGLLSKTVPLRLQAGSEQVGLLNSVCPVSSWPSIVIIHQGQVLANWQHGQTPFETVEKALVERFGSSKTTEPQTSTQATATSSPVYIDLPPSEGRMRLLNNAYDHFRTLTQRGHDMGLSDRLLLKTQLRWLAQMNIDVMTNAANAIQPQVETLTKAPVLSGEVLNRLLNTPASALNSQNPSAASSITPVSSATSSSTPRNQSQPINTSQPQSRRPTGHSTPSTQPPPPTSSSSSQATQRANYITAQREREAASKAERERVRSQIAADKKARREAEAARAAEQRRSELQELRKANSTRLNPQATDVRIQVRLLDGSTIRNSFAHDATISKNVRDWIDNTVKTKAESVGGGSQPYNLKLILAPQPNRNIEAGEEDSALCDVEGINSSATMVMVPVRGYVDSYASTGSGGVTGLLGSAITGGVGLVGSAAGWAVGGLGRLMGGGTETPQQNPGSQAVQSEVSKSRVGENRAATANSGNARVRTLADQRRDEDDESKRKGTQLYNGMGLNVQPRKDEDDDTMK